MESFEPAGILFELPGGWSSEPRGERALRIENEDGSLQVSLTIADKDDPNAIRDELLSPLGDVDVRVSWREGRFYRTQGVSSEGTGTYEGATLRWEITFLRTKILGRTPAVLMSWSAPELRERPPEDVAAFFQSIHAL